MVSSMDCLSPMTHFNFNLQPKTLHLILLLCYSRSRVITFLTSLSLSSISPLLVFCSFLPCCWILQLLLSVSTNYIQKNSTSISLQIHAMSIWPSWSMTYILVQMNMIFYSHYTIHGYFTTNLRNLENPYYS